jgi:hypothetical protein
MPFARYSGPEGIGPRLVFLLLLALSCGERSRASDAPPPAQKASAAKELPEWVPAEHKEGGRRWRDTGVYVDGQPIGVLWFGELPEALEPVWLNDVMSLDFAPGDPGPREKTVRVRRYRLRDYLAAAGIAVDEISMVHIYGGRQFVAAVTGSELRRVGDRLYFGFGSQTSGKPLIYFPADLETNTSFDHISAVAVYIEREPPALLDSGEVAIDGQRVDGIPYYGEPLRGGVRVYKDDRLATWIKRRLLEGEDELADRAGGELRWNFLPYIESRGVAVGDVVRAEVIFDERRTSSLGRDQLETMYFTASPQARGKLLFGPDRVPVQALALFSLPATPPTP